MNRADIALPAFVYDRPLVLYRLCKTKYADLSGLGAARFPARWNHPGQRAVYTATSQALALAEVLVHFQRDARPQGYSMLTIELKAGADLVVRRTVQEANQWFNQFGTALSESPEDPIALVAPSVIVPEYNVVLYPRPTLFEPDFATIRSIEPFTFDQRLFDEFAPATA